MAKKKKTLSLAEKKRQKNKVNVPSTRTAAVDPDKDPALTAGGKKKKRASAKKTYLLAVETIDIIESVSDKEDRSYSQQLDRIVKQWYEDIYKK